MLNEVVIVGRLTKAPELRSSSKGKSFVPFTVACNRMNNETVFIPCFAWNKVAENMAKYLQKGSLVAVVGALSSSRQKDSQYESLFVTARNVTFLDKISSNNAEALKTSSEAFTPPKPSSEMPASENKEEANDIKFADESNIIWE